jgi:hypothetical protein
MSDVIETLDKNIKTLEMLEKEYAKRATPRMKFVSIRSALNNAIISLKKTKDRYSEERAKEPQECNSDLISRKKLIEDIETLKNQIHILTKNIRGLVPTKCDNVSAINEKCNNIMTEIYAFQIGYNQPQVQPIVRTPEEVTEMLNKISCTECDRNSSHCHFSETECKNYWYEWLTKKEV